MSRTIHITVVVEDTARKQGLLGEHGLSFWIDTGSHRVLFDTGQGHALAPNACHLQIDLARADAIVLSHGHYDHTGGLCRALELAPHATLFLHPQALITRYSGSTPPRRFVGLAGIAELDRRVQEHRVGWTIQPTEVAPGIFATGEIPRTNDFEDTGGDFFIDADGQQPDPLLDDQALYLDSAPGLVVILGCAHAGVINTLHHIHHLTHRPIHAVIGGTHLVNASPECFARTIAALRDINRAIIAPAHCTGPRAMAALWTAFPERIADCSVGTQWTFTRNLEMNS